MTWNVRSVIATVLWVTAGLLSLFFLISGWWIFAPFVFAGGGGEEILILVLVIVGLATAAHVIGRRAPS